MNSRPNATELLAIVRETFTAEVLPVLPERLRYTGLMIANALAIARREVETGEGPLRAEYERLCTLLSEPPRELGSGMLAAAVADYNRRLARDIRSGRLEEGGSKVLLKHLRRTTEAKLAVSNPKALKDT